VIPLPSPDKQLNRKPERTLAEKWRHLAMEHNYAAGA